ncbi:uncharacterized protein [Watersipora subatra]|uniref:uncharacterized protein n=1 Tax=Watersipora subatra TaxID=2589382 RepID=UPI00355AFA02
MAMMAKRKRGNDEPLFSWHVGDLVNAVWPPSGRWYTANITELHAGEVTVQFRADNMNRRLKMHQIKHLIGEPEMQLVQLQEVKIVAEPMHSNPSVLIHHTIKEEPEGETRCDSDGKEESITHLVEVEERENDADCIATISVSDNHDATERQGTKKPRWTQLEKDVLSKLWQDKTTVPSKTILLKIKEALPHRSLAVLRARAHNFLKSSTAPNSQL